MSSRAVSRERRRERRGAAHRAKQSSESASRPAARIRRGHRPSWVVPELQPAGRRWTSGSVPGRRARKGLGTKQPAGGAASRISGWLAASTGAGGRASHVMHRLRRGPVRSACSGLRVCAVADCRYAPYRAAATCCSAVWHLVGDARDGRKFHCCVRVWRLLRSTLPLARARARYRDSGGRARPSGRRSSFLVSIPRAAQSAARLIVADPRRLGLRQAWAGPGKLARGSVESQQGMPAGACRGPPGRVAACAAWQLGRVGARDEEP